MNDADGREGKNDVGNGTQTGMGTSYPFDSTADSTRRTRHQRRTSIRLILATALVASLVVLFLATLFYFTEISRLSTENDTLRKALDKDELELAVLRPEHSRIKGELDAMVKGRFPNLHTLEPDKVLAINQGYVKNIVFSMVRQGRTKKYEYKLVMDNNSSLEVRPEFKIVVFDGHGIQIGADEVSPPANLIPGEVRSYSSALSLSMDGEPQYFMLTWKGSTPRRQAEVEQPTARR